MASKYKAIIAQRSIKTINNILSQDVFRAPNINHIVQNIKVERYGQNFRIKLPSNTLFKDNATSVNLSKFIEAYPTDDLFWAVTSSNLGDSTNILDLQFHITTNKFIKEVVCAPVELEKSNVAQISDLFLEKTQNGERDSNNRLVIDFSSPNVAKPFHMGHLRSTIMGNFIANIHEVLGHDVIRLNYLGDWGTQFGYLISGLKRHGIESIADLSELCEENTSIINKLNEIYVESNKLAENDPTLHETAKEIFARLESDDTTLIKQWELIRKITVDELERTYKRLNICMTVYHGESMYCDKQNNVASILTEKGILKKLEDGRQVVEIEDINKDLKNVIVRKSDGSSLYITRDIAAAIDRKQQFDFDKMIYVVEKAQSEHFKNLFSILDKLDLNWSHRLEHVSFGRIKGMSSRKGTSVFLSDILDEGKMKMIEQQKKSPNTKVLINDDDYHEIADVLAISAIVCNDLKQRKNKDYTFDWENVLHSKGDSGIKLQYTHARLTSLLLNMSLLNEKYEYEETILEQLIDQKTFTTLVEQEAIDLVHVISLFEEIVYASYCQLEPCILVNYLYKLCNVTSKALKKLGVKTAPHQQAANERLILFASSRVILKTGMKILGLKPLNRI